MTFAFSDTKVLMPLRSAGFSATVAGDLVIVGADKKYFDVLSEIAIGSHGNFLFEERGEMVIVDPETGFTVGVRSGSGIIGSTKVPMNESVQDVPTSLPLPRGLVEMSSSIFFLMEDLAGEPTEQVPSSPELWEGAGENYELSADDIEMLVAVKDGAQDLDGHSLQFLTAAGLVSDGKLSDLGRAMIEPSSQNRMSDER